MKKTSLAILLILLLFALPVHAGAPMDALKDTVNKMMDILRDPKLKGDAFKEAKKAKLRPIYDRMFDEVELSKRVLAKNWNAMNTAQRQEFVNLFHQILEKAYADKILAYTDETIVYDREIPLSPTQAEVSTRIVTASKEIPIVYRMILKNGVWKIYEVVIETMSLIQNYRTQFNEILTKDTPDQLIESLRKKVKEQ